MKTERTERTERMNSVAIMMEYFWIYLRHLHSSVTKRLGEPGIRAVAQGIRQYGHYRGESIRSSPRGCATKRGAPQLLQAWDIADLSLYSPDGQVRATGSARELRVELQSVPGSEYFRDKEGQEILEIYWRETLAGLAAGYDEALDVTHDRVRGRNDTPWAMTWRHAPASESDLSLQDIFADSVRAIEQSRRTAGVFAALCMFTGRSLIEHFGASGEEAAREALYNFGYERATGMREAALSQGKALDFQSWFDVIQQRDPNSSAWVFRGDTHISPGVFQVTCTYCPMARVWSEEGHDGLAFGYLYDTEVHRGLVEGFNPAGVVAWEKVKTRGDRVCNFRFAIPELVRDDDPEWAKQLTS